MEGPSYFYHTAAILCKEIQQFPEAIEFIKKEVHEGRLTLDLHGWEHINYGELSVSEISEHLDQAFIFFDKHFGCLPYRWCTPWGAKSDNINQAATLYGLIVEGVDLPVIDQSDAVRMVRESNNVECLFGKTVMVHWFERGLKLYRIIKAAECKSWEKAAKKYPNEFATEKNKG
jgi:peptidoglycan/xylan/chitin deacetylase (PgdA/CDA1 family)